MHEAKFKQKYYLFEFQKKLKKKLNFTLLQALKNKGSDIGSFRYDLVRFDFKPFGASFVILTPTIFFNLFTI